MWLRLPKKEVTLLIVSITGFLVGAALVGTFGRWLRDRYCPMSETTSHCLICDRIRIDSWIWGGATTTEIKTNDQSNWIDTFETPAHVHHWKAIRGTMRSSWFGSQRMGCGGFSVLNNIYHSRKNWGENKAQEVAKAFHRLVRLPVSDPSREAGMLEFTNGAMTEPDALIRACPP